MCQIWYANVKANRIYGLDKKTQLKPIKFDLEVKGQGRIGIMNVRDTSSHGDRPMCKNRYANVKANRIYGPDTTKTR